MRQELLEILEAVREEEREILEEGADISTMAVQYAPNVTKQYMADRCEKLGITVPDDYEAIEAE